jgi:hypothetical protein
MKKGIPDLNSNKTWVVIGLLSAALVLGFSMRRQESKSNFTSLKSNPKSLAQHSIPNSSPNIAIGAVQYRKMVNPWDPHQPLSAAENEEFEMVRIQVQKYLAWGKMDPEAIPVFRQTLFKLGDRAVAQLARELSQLSKESIKDKRDAETVVQKLDELAYFAASSHPLAGDSIAALAKRPVSWNDHGELQNPVEANITFEMFDIFAKLRPMEASNFIVSIDKKHRAAYFTRYAYGRKLAGKNLDDIDTELKLVFGSVELALR